MTHIDQWQPHLSTSGAAHQQQRLFRLVQLRVYLANKPRPSAPGCFDTIPSCVSWENDRICAHPNFHKTLDTHLDVHIFAGASIPASIDLKVSNKESMSLSLAKSESHTCRPEYLTRWKARQPLTVKRIHTKHYQNSLLKTFS